MVSSEGSNVYQQAESRLSQHFVQAHGVLQNLELRMKERLRERRDELKTSVDAIRDELSDEEDKLAMAFAMALTARERTDMINLRKLTEKLLDLTDSPCHLMANDDEREQIRMEIDNDWLESLNHVRLYVPETPSFRLLRTNELPDDYELESIKSDENLSTTLRGSYRRDSPSPLTSTCNSSSPANQSFDESISGSTTTTTSAPPPPEPSSLAKGKAERARITCFTDPTDFYVLKSSDERLFDEMQLQIERRLTVAANELPTPKHVEHNSLYIVQNTCDRKWYRGRVTRSQRQQQSSDDRHQLYDVYYVDLGSRDYGVPIERIRQLDANLNMYPGLAMHCTLEEIVPVDGNVWAEEQLKSIMRVITGHTFVTTVLSCDGDKFTVELMFFNGSKEQTLRDFLVITGLAKINSFQKLKRINPRSAHQFYYEDLPMEDRYVKVTVMNVISPSCIYVRIANDKPFHNKMEHFQREYGGILKHENMAVKHPEIGDTVALSHDLNYYRAYITNVIHEKSKLEVFLVDTGETKIVKFTDVTRLPQRYCQWTARAIKVFLVDIEPVEPGPYSERAVQYLRQHLTYQTVKILPISKSGNAYGVAMLASNETNVNANLVSIKYAVSTGQFSKHATLNNDISAPAQSRKKPKSKYNKKSKNDASSEKLSLQLELMKVKAERQKLPSRKAEESDPFRVRVQLHKVISPDEMYVSQSSEAAVYEAMCQQMQNFYSENRAECPGELDEGVYYCVYSPKDRQYCRAMYLGESRRKRGRVAMSLIDLAEVIEVERQEIQPLNTRFLGVSKHIFRIKLAGVSPCGGSKTWPSSSCRKLKEIIEGSGGDTKYYITLTGSDEEDEVIPVDLLLRRNVAVGPTEPNRRENVSVRRRMIEDGHAFPIRGYDDNKEKELAVELKKKLKLGNIVFVDNTAEASKNNLTPIEEEAMPDGDVEINGKGDAETKADVKEVEDEGIEQRDEKEVDSETENAEDYKDTSSDSMALPAKMKNWIPAAHLVQDEFNAKVTYVGYNGEVYFHPDTKEYNDTLTYIKETLHKQYRNKSMKKYDTDWEVGDLCIAQYHVDKKWYRAVVTDTSKYKVVTVKFVDYGNIEDCQIGALKKRISLTEIPIQITSAAIAGLKAVNNKWEETDLDIIHSIIVDKKVKVKILSKPPKPWKAAFWLIDGEMPVSVSWYIKNRTQVKCVVDEAIEKVAVGPEEVLPDGSMTTDSTVLAVIETPGFYIPVNNNDSDDSSEYESVGRKSINSEDVSDAGGNSDTIKNGNDVDSENTVHVNRTGSSNGAENSSGSSNSGGRRRSTSIDSSDTVISPNISDGLRNGHHEGEEYEEDDARNANQEKLLSGNSIYLANDLNANDDVQSVKSEALNSEFNCPLIASTPLNASLTADDSDARPKSIDFFVYKLRCFQMSIGQASSSTKMTGYIVDCDNEELRYWKQKINLMQQEIQSCAKQQPPLTIAIGAMGIAEHDNGQWYRAQVVDKSESGITVEFIDFGDCLVFKDESEIRTAKREWLEGPKMSFSFKFYNVRVPEGGEDAAWAALARILNGHSVLTAFIKVYEPVLLIDLYLDENCKKLAYSTLIKDGLFEVIDPEID